MRETKKGGSQKQRKALSSHLWDAWEEEGIENKNNLYNKTHVYLGCAALNDLTVCVRVCVKVQTFMATL